MMTHGWTWLRTGALALVLALGACGGGGSSSGDAGLGSAGIEGAGTGIGGVTGDTGAGGGGTSVAGGVGSGGTGISGEGVGSGGTGATADAAGIGSVDGFGSIIVNGVRFDISTAQLFLSDATALRLGMTVRVSGTIDPDLSEGTATAVVSAADLRGPVAAVDPASQTFQLLSVQVSTDASTAYGGGLGSLADLAAGDLVQVHGLPGSNAQLRATRIERVAGPAASVGPVLSGPVTQLDTQLQTFRIGTQQVHYAGATFSPAAPVSSLAEGQLVRVRAATADAVLEASSVEPWYPVQAPEGKRLSLSGLVTHDTALGTLRIDGVPVDTSAAQFVGGRASELQDGARVEATGTVTSGVLVATRITLRHGSLAPQAPTFSARGPVGAYQSPSHFKVQGQDIDASGAGVVFAGGTPAELGPGHKVQVTGSRVVDDVLLADRVEFLN